MRLQPALDEELERIAERRGCSVSDLLREAAIQHFSLFESVSQTHNTRDIQNNGTGTSNGS